MPVAATLLALVLGVLANTTSADTKRAVDKATAPTSTPSAGAWIRYPTSYQGKTEAPNQSWYNLAWDIKRNVAYGISWDGMLSAFDPAKERWNDIADLGNTNDYHNRTTAYDPINDYVWATDGTGAAFPGLRYFDLGTKTWQLHSKGGPSYQSTMIFDPEGKRFVAFGGWQSQSPNVRTLALAPPGAGWVSAGVTTGPRFTNDTQKMTAQRSVLDTKRNRIVYVDTDGSLWTLALSPFVWQRVATTGTPPPPRTQYVYDADNDVIVGWFASPNIAAGESLPGPRRETWLLPLDTLAWSKAANVADGAKVPPETVYVGYSVVHDPVRKQMLLHTLTGTSNWGPETWGYRYPTAR